MRAAITARMIMILLVTVSSTVFGQMASDRPSEAVHVSGRIVDPAGAALPHFPLNFRKIGVNVVGPMVSVKTDQDGRFLFTMDPYVGYQFYVMISEVQPSYLDIGTLEGAAGEDIDLGSIVLKVLPRNLAGVHVAGPISATSFGPSAHQRKAKQRPSSIAAILVACSGPPDLYCDHNDLRVLFGNGKDLQLSREKNQVGYSLPAVAKDGRAAGWLAKTPFCCTSYPIALQLQIYRPGKPLRRFSGDGRAIFHWRFVRDGKYVAFYQDFLHGTSMPHYELRDVDTGKLRGKWNGELTARAPKWARELGS